MDAAVLAQPRPAGPGAVRAVQVVPNLGTNHSATGEHSPTFFPQRRTAHTHALCARARASLCVSCLRHTRARASVFPTHKLSRDSIMR